MCGIMIHVFMIYRQLYSDTLLKVYNALNKNYTIAI